MAYETILYEIEGPVLTITLNRPDKLNAYTGVMGAELTDAFERADQDDAVRVVIVTGAGRGFCAGADISGGADAFDTNGLRPPPPRSASSSPGGGWCPRPAAPGSCPSWWACRGRCAGA